MVNKVFSNNAEVVMGKLVQNIHEDVLKVLIILVCGVFFSHLSFSNLLPSSEKNLQNHSFLLEKLQYKSSHLIFTSR